MSIKSFLAIFVAILLVSLLAGCSLFSSSPGKTVEKFYRAVEAGEIDTAAGYLSNKVLQNLGYEKLKQGLTQQTRNINDKGRIRTIEITNEDIIGETAQVTVKVTFGNGETTTEKINLVKEEGDWRIDMTSK